MIYDFSSLLPYKPLRAYLDELPKEATDFFRATAIRRVYGEDDCLMFPGERLPYFGLVLEGLVCGFTRDSYQRKIHWIAGSSEGFAGLIPAKSAKEQIHIGFLSTTQLLLISPSHLRYARTRFASCKKMIDDIESQHLVQKKHLNEIQNLKNPEDRAARFSQQFPLIDPVLSTYQREELIHLPISFSVKPKQKRKKSLHTTKRKPTSLTENNV